MIDLGSGEFSTKKADSEGVLMILRHPSTDEDLIDENGPITIRVVGKDSKAAKSFKAEQAKKYRGKTPTLAAFEKAQLEYLAACTLEFNNLTINSEKKTSDDAYEVYESASWIKEQVDEFIANRSNFLGN